MIVRSLPPPRKDSGLVRSVSLALGSRSQTRRLCSRHPAVMMSPLRKLRGHIGFGDSAVHIFYGDCLGVSKPTGFWLPQRREQEEW